MLEVWKSIKEYPDYLVSNMGNIKNIKTNKYLKPIASYNGYQRVGLYKDGKMILFSVHRLVANAFLSNPSNLPQVNHKDENKLNNTVENLEWCTAKYNANYGNKSKRTVETKIQKGSYERFRQKVVKAVVCLETKKIYSSIKEASEVTGLNRAGLSRACTGVYKTCGGFHWSFARGVS